MTNEVLLRLLVRLFNEKEMAYSSVASGSRKELESWGERKGCIAVEKSGGGKKFKITNQKILDWEIKRLDPQIELENLPERLQNLAVNQDTKAGKTTLEYSYVICKAVGVGILVNDFDVSAATSRLGSFSLPVGENAQGVKSNGSLLLVENQQLIDDLKWIPEGFKGIVLYYAGNLSTRLLAWLKQSSFLEIFHFPDYDAVGISNYANLVQYVSGAKWFWMPNWEEKFAKYGCKELRKKGNLDSMFENLWNTFMKNGFPDPELEHLMSEIRKQGKMLEQESVLL